MLEYILSLAGALDESFTRRLAPMSTTEILNQDHGICLVQITFYEEIDLASVIEQCISAIDELTNWRGVCKKQKRAKALRSSQVSKEFLKERTRPGFKKALKDFDYSAEYELEFYENKLTDIIKYRRDLISESKKISEYLASLDYDQYDKISRGLNYFERVDKLINLADRKVIPGLRSIIRVLKDIDKKDTKRVSKIKSSRYNDKKHGRRVRKRPDQPHKHNRDIARDIARVNKSVGRRAFM